MNRRMNLRMNSRIYICQSNSIHPRELNISNTTPPRRLDNGPQDVLMVMRGWMSKSVQLHQVKPRPRRTHDERTLGSGLMYFLLGLHVVGILGCLCHMHHGNHGGGDVVPIWALVGILRHGLQIWNHDSPLPCGKETYSCGQLPIVTSSLIAKPHSCYSNSRVGHAN